MLTRALRSHIVDGVTACGVSLMHSNACRDRTSSTHGVIVLCAGRQAAQSHGVQQATDICLASCDSVVHSVRVG